MMLWYGLIGLLVGSFLNLCIDRLPRGQSIAWPPSHCGACGKRIRPWDLVPVLSYLWLRGRCRHCNAPIAPRLPLVELGTALLFAYLGFRYGITAEALVLGFYGALFIVVFVIDLEHQIIPNRLVYPAIVAALALALLWPRPGLLSALAGALIAFAVLLIPYLLYPAGMGTGDVKLALVIGLATGFPLVLISLATSFVLGGAVAAFLLLLRLKKRKDAIPFGPFLATGTMITLLWGDALLSWYLGQWIGGAR